MTWTERYRRHCSPFLLAIVFAWQLSPLHAQADLPDIPDIIVVTAVHPDSVLIRWEPSQDTGVDLYNMYKMDEGTGKLIYTFSSITYSFKFPAGPEANLAYAVTAVDTLDGNHENESLFEDNIHQAVSTSLAFDPCEPSIAVSWTGYVGWEHHVSGYRIYGGLAGGEPEYLGFTSPDSRSYVRHDVLLDTSYVFYVEAINISGITSLSVLDTIRTVYPGPPDLLRIDRVSVLDRSTAEIQWTADISGAANGFRIMRKEGSQSPFEEIGTVWNPSQSTQVVTDQVHTTLESYQYKVEALFQPEGCTKPAVLAESNPGTSILLSEQVEDLVVRLSWTPYESYESGLSGYIIQRRNGDGSFIDVCAVGPATTLWSESIETMLDGYQPGQVQYKVLAVSNQVEGGDPGISASNPVNVEVESHFKVPDAFTPGSNDVNSEFRPRIDFAPKAYLLMIFDRTGRVLFETTDPGQGWDGTSRNGGFVMEGVYVYHIRYTDYTGISRSITGNVTVIFP